VQFQGLGYFSEASLRKENKSGTLIEYMGIFCEVRGGDRIWTWRLAGYFYYAVAYFEDSDVGTGEIFV
jgi:hypothetical protein